MTKEIHFDWKIYNAIVETGRLYPLSDNLGESLRLLHDKGKLEEQVGVTFVFSNEKGFDSEDKALILRVHTPLDANAYWYNCEDNALIIKFYKTKENDKR